MTSLRWVTFSQYQTKKNIDFLLGTFRFVPKKAFLISSVESPRKDYHIFQLQCRPAKDIFLCEQLKK